MEGRKRSLTNQASVGAPNLCGGGGRLRRRTVRAGRFSTDYDPPVEIHASLASALNAVVSATGPPGAGTSTTMASPVDAINATRACHILTIEDPIEYLHLNRQAVVHQREVGLDAQSFARALRAALREDPDVVLVGEMRDPESISITLTLAETGHLVISSLHTNDASQTLDRIVDVFPAERQGQIRQPLAPPMS